MPEDGPWPSREESNFQGQGPEVDCQLTSTILAETARRSLATESVRGQVLGQTPIGQLPWL